MMISHSSLSVNARIFSQQFLNCCHPASFRLVFLQGSPTIKLSWCSWYSWNTDCLLTLDYHMNVLAGCHNPCAMYDNHTRGIDLFCHVDSQATPLLRRMSTIRWRTDRFPPELPFSRPLLCTTCPFTDWKSFQRERLIFELREANIVSCFHAKYFLLKVIEFTEFNCYPVPPLMEVQLSAITRDIK